MPTTSLARIKALPAADEHWLVVIHRMRLWITPPNEPPARPYGLFIFVLENGYALGSDLTPDRVASIVDLWRDETLGENLRLSLIKHLLRAGYASDDILPLIEKSLSPELRGTGGEGLLA